MTYTPPKKNTAFVFYCSLSSQANSRIMQANPTLAAGDVKVAVDDAAPANITTLPTVDADFTKRIKVSLSAAEMNGDNTTVIFSDAAGDEWCDLTANIQTSVQQIDDLATPTNITAGTITTVTNLTNAPSAGDLTATMKTSVTTAATAATPTAAAVTGAVGSVTGNVGGNVVGSVASVTAGVTLAAAAVQAIWDALTSALTTVGSVGKLLVDNINATVSSRASQASVDDLPTNAELTTALGTADDAVLAQVALVKAKTDGLTFTVAGQVDSNVKSVAGTTVTGVGSEADPWGP